MHRIRMAQTGDCASLVAMRLILWPQSSSDEETEQVQAVLSTGMSGTLPAAILVAEGDDGALIGFLAVGLRSHADGCDTLRPVGFIEGWYVDSACRGRGIGRDLVRTAEDWSRGQGCVEMASDALIDNEESHRAHQALGFEVVDRCVHFRKTLQIRGGK